MKFRPFSLLLGLCIGTAAWFYLRPSAREASTSPPSPPTTRARAWAWRDTPTPPGLAPDLVGPAIDAWRDLREPDGSAANHTTRAIALRALLVRLPSAGYPRLLDTLPPPDTEANRHLLRLAYDTWVSIDAAAATRWAVDRWATPTGKSKGFADLARQAIVVWAALDAAAAANWACTLPDQKMIFDLASSSIMAFAKVDPARALALARSHEAPFRNALVREVASTSAEANPAAILQNLPPEAWNQGMSFYDFRDSLRAWARLDPAATLAWLAKQPRSGTQRPASWVGALADSPEQKRILGALVAADPDFPDQAGTLGDLIIGTGEPAEALAWLSAHADPALRLDVLLRISDQYALDHPERTLPFALALPPSQRRSAALGRLLAAWQQQDASATLAWMRQQNDPGVTTAYAQLQARQLVEIARGEPTTALAEWTRLSDPRVRVATITPLAEAWGKNDPAAALRWQTEQNAALGAADSIPSITLLAAWAKQDPEAALRWTETIIAAPSSAQKPTLPGQLLGALAGPWNDQAPLTATANLYSKIKDPALRAQTLTSHIKEWLTKDPAAAKTWLESHDALTPAQAASLLQSH
ncbi:hypothetical protein IMCC26134_02065 [Verrucomicrobia bacterium IMCC26134]|nr:hypothetical protein IMCC26134_02065 [Verrucomicrobia bacterium IMCC26134]